MASVWAELKRRNVVRVGIAYGVVAWLLVEVASVMAPALNLPDWSTSLVAFLVILGFPVALVLSWAYELTPDGMKRSHEVDAAQSITPVTGRKINFAIIGALVLALGFVVYNYVLVDGSLGDPGQQSVATVEPVSAPAPVEQARLPNSVAVLPFDNLSPDPDNAYFAAGIHDTILNELAKLQNLNVIARTSVLQYADGQTPIPEIGEALNVETVMEGSVQYANGRILVTAQLIDSSTNVHLWSDNYDREFADIFGIQADIAMNIANALEAEFSEAEQERIEKIPTDSPAAYALYLQALTSLEITGGDSWRPALDRALALDPEFALAHATKAYLNAFLGFSTWPAEIERIVLDSAARALELDPTLALAHSALAYLYLSRWEFDEARAAFDRAVEFDPNDPATLTAYSRFLRNLGEYEEAVRRGRRATELDPSNALYVYQFGLTLRYARDYDAAYEMFRRTMALNPGSFNAHLQVAFTEIGRGDLAEAVTEIRTAEELYIATNEVLDDYRFSQFAFAYSLLGQNGDVERFIGQLEVMDEASPLDDGIWTTIHLALGEDDQALQRLETAIDEQTRNVFSLAEIKANALQLPVLEEPRFQALRDRIGTID